MLVMEADCFFICSIIDEQIPKRVIGGSKYDVIHTGPKLVQLSGDC
jgi:hypothetical protein